MDWKDVIKTVAPWIGTALTGPLGGLAVEAAANALGLGEKTTEAIKTSLSGATPEQMLALKKADQDFALQMQALGFKQVTDLEALAVADRKDARAMQVANKRVVPALLTGGVAITFAITLAALFKFEVPITNRDLVVYMCGQLSAAFAACLAFWVGTTRQSEDKTQHMMALNAKKDGHTP